VGLASQTDIKTTQ